MLNALSSRYYLIWYRKSINCILLLKNVRHEKLYVCNDNGTYLLNDREILRALKSHISSHRSWSLQCAINGVIYFQALAALPKYLGKQSKAKNRAKKFRNEGRLASTDSFCLDGASLKTGNFYTLRLNLNNISKVLYNTYQKRHQKGIVTVINIGYPQKLLVDSAIMSFNLRTALIATYGIRIIWLKLIRDLTMTDRVVAGLLKLTLGLHTPTQNTLAYLLVDSSWFLKDIRKVSFLRGTVTYRII